MSVFDTSAKRTTQLTPLVPTACKRSASGYLGAVLADSPLGYWKLDDISGVTAVDSSGNGFNGTYVNTPTLNQAPLITSGRSIVLASASSQCVSLPAIANAGLSVRTLEVWISTVQSSASNPVSVAADDSSFVQRFILDSPAGTPNKAEAVWRDSGGAAHAYQGAVTINDGTRHHVVTTYDGATIKIYVDGVADGVGSASVFALPTGTINSLNIGKVLRGGASSSFLNGTVDEVAIYNTALSAARVAAHFTAGTT